MKVISPETVYRIAETRGLEPRLQSPHCIVLMETRESRRMITQLKLLAYRIDDRCFNVQRMPGKDLLISCYDGSFAGLHKKLGGKIEYY